MRELDTTKTDDALNVQTRYTTVRCFPECAQCWASANVYIRPTAVIKTTNRYTRYYRGCEKL